MYTIVLVAALFGNNNQIPTQTQYITQEACTIIATKLTNASGIEHKCVPSSVVTKH